MQMYYCRSSPPVIAGSKIWLGLIRVLLFSFLPALQHPLWSSMLYAHLVFLHSSPFALCLQLLPFAAHNRHNGFDQPGEGACRLHRNTSCDLIPGDIVFQPRDMFHPLLTWCLCCTNYVLNGATTICQSVDRGGGGGEGKPTRVLLLAVYFGNLLLRGKSNRENDGGKEVKILR